MDNWKEYHIYQVIEEENDKDSPVAIHNPISSFDDLFLFIFEGFQIGNKEVFEKCNWY